MKLIEELVEEHALIERVAGSFLSYVASQDDARAIEDGRAYLRFFRAYANHFHHAREEDVLFAAIRDHARLPVDRGPIKVMVDDHTRMGGLLDRLEALFEPGAAERSATLAQDLATSYVHALWHHIDAENSVLFPESEPRLRRAGVSELPSRPMTDEERTAKETGENLLRRYPPASDDKAMRGDGCVMCPAFGDTCRGLELEWWNIWEWDEFEDHLTSG